MVRPGNYAWEPPDLQVRAERNLAEHACHKLRHTGMVPEADDVVVADSGLDDDNFNVVAAARFRAGDVAIRTTQVVRILAASRRRFCWWVGPASAPADLETHLMAAGMKATEWETGIWADVSDTPSEPHVDDLLIRRVTTTAMLDDFATVYSARCVLPVAVVRRYFADAAGTILNAESAAHLLVCYAGGCPVSTVEVFFHAGVAGLYNCVTSPAHRGRGYARAVLLAAHRLVRDAGYPVAIGQATSGGEALLRTQGFRVYGQFTGYSFPVRGGIP